MGKKRGKIEKSENERKKFKEVESFFLINSNAFNTNEWNEKVVIKRLAINSFISDAHSIENLKKIFP